MSRVVGVFARIETAVLASHREGIETKSTDFATRLQATSTPRRLGGSESTR